MGWRFITLPKLGLVVSLFAAATLGAGCGDDDDNQVTPEDSGVPDNNVINADGGADTGTPDTGPPVKTRFSRPSHGSAIDVSEDDTIVLAANTDVGSVSIFDVTYPGAGAPPKVTKRAEVPVCAEPVQVALVPQGDKGVVVCRKDQKLVRVDNLRTTPVKGAEVKVGSEPTGVALTPKATKAWVANWVDGTAMEVDVGTMAVTATVDLNAALVATTALGTVASRPALAHPRSVAITNNNDDLENDESVFVTEYFAQTKEPLTANGSNADSARQGYVYKINPTDKTVKTIALPPIADMGFNDHTNTAAGCFPNQVTSVNIQGSFAYVTAICASPKGPFGLFTGPGFVSCANNGDADCPGAGAGSCNVANNTCKTNCTADAQCGALGGVCTNNLCAPNLVDVKTTQTPSVHVIDIGGSKVVASVSLNSEFDKYFTTLALPNTSARRLPLQVWDLSFVPGTLTAYMAAKGSDAVYRVQFNATYETKAVDAVGSTDRPFIALDQGTLDATKQGKLPIGISVAHRSATTSADRFAFVLNDATRNVTVLDLKVDNIAGVSSDPVVVSSAAKPTDATEEAKLEGRRLFSTGLGRWSLNGQAWISCESCHVDGLSDQVTWFHVRGPRQSPSIDQSVNKKNGDLRALAWQASVDELEDFELGGLRVTAGGIGSVVKALDLAPTSRIAFDVNGHGGLAGSAKAAADPASTSQDVTEVCILDDWKKLAVYMKAIRTPKKPSNLDATKVAAGKTHFETAKCQGCHGGDHWTISKVFYTPDKTNATAPNLANNTNFKLRSKAWDATAITTAGFPAGLLPSNDVASQTMRYNGTNVAGLDSLTCLLRPVGTYNVAETGVGIAELRRDHVTAAQGNLATLKGFNVPSLLGLAVNAPYFHAGQARTLEAALSDTFSSHHASLVTDFLANTDANAATKREALVQYLLSIDEETPSVAIPADVSGDGGNFCALP